MHNGIVTNYKKLRNQLAAVPLDWEGETDTEVVAKLTMHLYDQNPSVTFDQLAQSLAGRLEGAFSILIKSIHFAGEVIANKKGSPLIVGLNEQATKGLQSLQVSYVSKEEERPYTNGVDGSHDTAHSNGTNGNLVTSEANVATSSVWSNECLFASDPSAIAEYTKKMVFLEDGDIAHMHSGYLDLYNTGDLSDSSTERKIQLFDHLDRIIPSKGTHAHYMQKEIYEQPDTIKAALRSWINSKSDQINFPGLLPYMDRIRACAKIHFIACGSSYYVCLAMQELFESVVGVDVSFDIASAFLDKSPRVSTNVAYVFVSQSGETAECLSALQHCQKYGHCGTNAVFFT
jgi:glucosamine--fructose-6-phosphate aminotransferase (isomerizing)